MAPRSRAGSRSAGRSFGGDFKYWKAGASWEHGIKVFKSHNFVYSASTRVGKNLPFTQEMTAGGTNLRGYLYQQFRGDTQVHAEVEYHFPLFSIGPLDFRALGLLRRLGGLVPQSARDDRRTRRGGFTRITRR